MEYLLKNRFAPVTYCWGFIKAPIESTIKQFISWNHRTLRLVKRDRMIGNLSQLLTSLEPLDPEGRTSLFCETQGDWTACFENSSKTPEVETTIFCLIEQLKTTGLVFTAIPDTISDQFPAKRGTWGEFGFILFDSNVPHPMRVLRKVHVNNDADGWEFNVDGQVQPFEQQSSYERRLKKDRVTMELLKDYAKSFGIELLKERFYGQNAVKVFADYPFRKLEKVTYIKAQERLGLPINQ